MDSVKFFVPARITKSQDPNNKDIDFGIECCITDESKDLQGDEIPTKILDFTNIDNGFGRIKYEHQTHPDSHVGFPTSRREEGTSVIVEGRIYAKHGTEQYHLAKSLMDDLANIEEWNKNYIKDPQKYGNVKQFGISIEGPAVVYKSTGKLKKVSVTNLVFTTEPIHQKTYVQVKKSFYNKENFIIKSAKAMFKTQEEAVTYYKGLGQDDTTATASATAYFVNETRISKSLLDGTKEISEGLSFLKGIEENFVEGSDEDRKFVRIKKSLKDAVNSSDESKAEDIFLGSVKLNEELIDYSRNSRKEITEISKRIFKSLQFMFDSLEGIASRQKTEGESINVLGSGLGELSLNIKKSASAISTNIDAEKGADDPANNGDDLKGDERVQRISKSLKQGQIADALMRAQAEDKVSIAQVSAYKTSSYRVLPAGIQVIVDEYLKPEIEGILKKAA